MSCRRDCNSQPPAAFRFKQALKSRLKLCNRCITPRNRVQWQDAASTSRAPRMTDTTAAIPEGFERHFRQSPLTAPWEPLYSKRTDKAVIIALRLARAHTNARGLIHGGLIAALADSAMGHSCVHVMGGVSALVTIGLAVDFIGSAQVGQWLAVESE